MIGISLGYSNSKHSEKGRIIRLLDPHPYNFVYQESNDALSRKTRPKLQTLRHKTPAFLIGGFNNTPP